MPCGLRSSRCTARDASPPPSSEHVRQRISIADLIETEPASSAFARNEDVDMSGSDSEIDEDLSQAGMGGEKVDAVAVQALLEMSSTGSSPVNLITFSSSHQ